LNGQAATALDAIRGSERLVALFEMLDELALWMALHVRDSKSERRRSEERDGAASDRPPADRAEE
jgi:hypothetical protein